MPFYWHVHHDELMEWSDDINKKDRVHQGQ